MLSLLITLVSMSVIYYMYLIRKAYMEDAKDNQKRYAKKQDTPHNTNAY